MRSFCLPAAHFTHRLLASPATAAQCEQQHVHVGTGSSHTGMHSLQEEIDGEKVVHCTKMLRQFTCGQLCAAGQALRCSWAAVLDPAPNNPCICGQVCRSAIMWCSDCGWRQFRVRSLSWNPPQLTASGRSKRPAPANVRCLGRVAPYAAALLAAGPPAPIVVPANRKQQA